MATCEVSKIVASIVSAYNSGLDLFRRLNPKCKKRSKSSSKDTKVSQEEALLQASLQHRPRDIRSAYDSSVALLGHRFEIGDSIAHSSLAQVLLALNSGLINILNNTLSDDIVKRRHSQRSLLRISEVAAVDALYALGQLNHRLTTYQPRISAPMPMQTQEAKPKKRTHSKTPSKTIIDIKIDPKVKSRAENNLLVRGGWVRPRPATRSKSGSSVVTSSSSRNASSTKLVDHKRSQPTSTGTCSLTKSLQSSPRPRHARTESAPAITQTPQHIAELPDNPQPQRRQHTSDHRRLPREPSMLIVSSDFFSSQISLPPSRPHHSNMRPRPPSVATFMTASTKIGEIPEHRWPDRIPAANEELRPMPYVIPPPLNAENVAPKKKARGFRFWRKAEPVMEAAVY